MINDSFYYKSVCLIEMV